MSGAVGREAVVLVFTEVATAVVRETGVVFGSNSV